MLVRVDSVGICGSDVHYYLHGSTSAEKPAYPFIIGHECSGEVVETGPGARGLKPGDRVFIEPNVPCMDCDMCKAGNFNFCRRPEFLGYPGQMDGAMREIIAMPAGNLFRFRKGLSFEEALMAEPLSIALYALWLSGRLKIRTAAILGTGSIGLCLVKAMKVMRKRWRVCSTDIVENRRELSRRNGSADSFDGDDTAVAEKILAATAGVGVDVVYECAGVPETVEQSLRILRPGGTLFVIGIPVDPVIRFDTDLFRKKGITVTYVRRQNGQALNALRMIESRRVDMKDIIGPVFSMAEAGKAFDLKIKKPGLTVKPIIRIR